MVTGEPFSSGQRESSKGWKNVEEILGNESHWSTRGQHYVSFPFLHLRVSGDTGSHFRINSQLFNGYIFHLARSEGHVRPLIEIGHPAGPASKKKRVTLLPPSAEVSRRTF